MKLVQLVDSLEYLRDNCWQHQLQDHLRAQCDEYVIMTKDDLKRYVLMNQPIPDSDVLLSTLKLRSAITVLPALGLKKRHIYVYDQDPWEAFVDQATYPGAYQSLNRCLNVTFINTSRWWSDYVKSRGMRSIFVRMWPKPEYCSEGTPWSSRPIRVGFKGKVHPHRQAAIQELEKLGVEVTVLPSGDYSSFLQDLSQMQFFFHEESGEKWSVGGQPLAVKNCGWAKDIEIVCRGCFALRLWEPEAGHYVKGIPGVKTFVTLTDVPKIIDDTLRNEERSDLESRQSVSKVRDVQGWFNLADLT